METLHGVEIVDPYRWLEADAETTPEVASWTAAQNEHTARVLGAWPHRGALRRRLAELLSIGTIGAPVVRGGRLFHVRREKQNQPVLHVRAGVDGVDRVLVDVNSLAGDGTVALDWWFPSREGNLVAWGSSEKGSELSTLRIRDVETGADLPDRIERTRAASLAWLPDGTGFYYTRYPSPETVPAEERAYHRAVRFHRIGTDPDADPLVFGAGRPMEEWPTVELSRDGRWLLVTVFRGWTSADLHLRDLSLPESDFVPLVEGEDASYSADVQADAVYVRTTSGAPNGRLFRVDPEAPERAAWREIVPESPTFVLESASVVAERLVLLGLEKASSRLRIAERDGSGLRDLPLPTLGSIAGIGGEEAGNDLFYVFESFGHPPSVHRHDFANGRTSIWRSVEAPSIRSGGLETSQVVVTSADGTAVTMFLVRRSDVRPDGNRPTLLSGYGGFASAETPAFSRSMAAWLEAGGVYALPNLRGGGEYGEEWHRAGMLGRKQNVFDDFLAAARWLVDEGWTNPARLAIYGGSNGGLLVGAALTMAPDLFRAAVAGVPLLDMLRYHRFRLGRLWVSEYGSADDPEQFRYLEAYSPYRNVRPGTRYPATLLTAGESDSRVDPLHARKMGAHLQASTSATPEERPVLVRIETKAGHGQGKPLALQVAESTDVWTFLMSQLSVTPSPAEGAAR